jgi:hypothetical protein
MKTKTKQKPKKSAEICCLQPEIAEAAMQIYIAYESYRQGLPPPQERQPQCIAGDKTLNEWRRFGYELKNPSDSPARIENISTYNGVLTTNYYSASQVRKLMHEWACGDGPM